MMNRIAIAAITFAVLQVRAADTPSLFGAGDNWMNFVLGKPKTSALLAVSKNNPDYKFVEAEFDRIRTNYAAAKVVRPTLHVPFQVHVDAALRLFPHYRFYVLCWDEEAVDKQNPPVGMGLGLYYTLALGADGEIRRFQGTGNFEEFGKFLSDAKVALKTSEDAKLVWNAFCEIHRRDWASHPSERISEKEWRLGKEVAYGFDRFYRVSTTTNGICASARFEAIRVK